MSVVTGSESGIGRATYVTGASWPVDGGMLGMGPQAGSHLTSDDWRRP
ncbi:hypothetical protein [Actinoplanes sp. NPDC049316]